MAKMVEEFHFLSKPSKDYFCPVTLEVMLNPRQTDCCGSHISSNAAEVLNKKRKPCPMCKAPAPDFTHRGSGPVFTSHRDQYFQRIILDLKVLCPYRGSGCEWVGPVREIRDHSASCKRRPWICQHCRIKTTYNIGTSEHAQKCPQRPIYCACSTTDPIPFSKYDDHLKACPVQMVPCEFADMGCPVKLFRKDHESHLKQSLHHHHLLTSQLNLRITKAIQSKLESKQEVSAEKVKQELEEKEVKINDLQKEVTILNGELSKLQMEVIKLQGQLKKQVEADNKEILDKLFEERDRELQVNRLRERMQAGDEEIQYLQERGVNELDTQNIVMMLTDVVEELKTKNNLQGKDIKKLVAQLEDILSMTTDGKSSESDSDGYVMAISPVDACTVEQGKDTPWGFKGVLEKTLIKGLRRVCGLAVSGEVVYVVDTNGTYGLHMVSGSSVKSMIESATFSDIHIPAGKCWYPKCVAIDKDLNILLVDSSCRVLKVSPSGSFLAYAGKESSAGSSYEEFNNPMGIAVDASGKIFVCDRLNHRIQILNSNLEFISTFGEKGSGLMEFRNPWDVSFDSQGNIYIADCGNRCVKVFSPEMSHLRNVGQGEGQYRIGLRAPTSICIDSKDNLYVADKGLKKVLIYNLEGIYISSFGKFLEPSGICVDMKGRVYVSDNGGHSGIFLSRTPGRVLVFT